MRYSRSEVLARLQRELEVGRSIVAAGAGTGISAKFAEQGGCDLVIVYNSGRFRMNGHGSLAGLLAYGDANEIVQEMGEREVLPVVDSAPVIAGVMGTDPTRQLVPLLRRLDGLGFSGINNFPTVGLIDGQFRAALEQTGMGFGREVALIQAAHELGFFTCPYVFDPDQGKAMTAAGADLLIAHLGLTVGGSIGLDQGSALSLDAAASRVQEIGEAATQVRDDVIILCHGGPIATPADAAYVLDHCDACGFVGASSMERLPVERAITTVVQEFKAYRRRDG